MFGKEKENKRGKENKREKIRNENKNYFSFSCLDWERKILEGKLFYE